MQRPCGPPPPARLGPRALPCSEFMVEEHELRKEKIQEDYNDKYWEQRYTVVQRHIPSFLQKMAGKVLSTGECRPRTPPRACVSTQQPAPLPLRSPGATALPGPRAPGSPHSSQRPRHCSPGRLRLHTAASAQRPCGYQLGDHPTELGSDT